jgi:hypothetical protein
MACLTPDKWETFLTKYDIDCNELFADKKMLVKFFELSDADEGTFVIFCHLDLNTLFANGNELIDFLKNILEDDRYVFAYKTFGIARLQKLLAADLDIFMEQFPGERGIELRNYLLYKRELTQQQVFECYATPLENVRLFSSSNNTKANIAYNHAILAGTAAERYEVLFKYMLTESDKNHPFYKNLLPLINDPTLQTPISDSISESSDSEYTTPPPSMSIGPISPHL